MARTHTFKGSNFDFGYYAFIDDGKLVIGEERGREGGILFSGTYEEAAEHGWLAALLRENEKLFRAIDEYYIKHGVKDKSDRKALGFNAEEELEAIKKKYGFDEETKTILFKVRLYMDNRIYHDVLVRGRFQADVIKKLMPPISEVLTLQTFAGEVFAVRSDKISAVEFLGD